jgi:hypothetical protein
MIGPLEELVASAYDAPLVGKEPVAFAVVVVVEMVMNSCLQVFVERGHYHVLRVDFQDHLVVFLLVPYHDPIIFEFIS